MEIAILPQFFAIEPHFDGNPEIAILPQFLTIEPDFVGKGCAGRLELALLLQFLAIEPHFVRKGCAGRLEIAIFLQFLAIEPHFVRKGLHRTPRNRNFTFSFWRSNLISCERVAFRAVSLALPRAFKREIEKKERARGQERKRAREKM